MEATTMNESEMMAVLAGLPEGTELFVSYVAGREPTDRAVREAQRSTDAGIARRHFTGKLHRVWTTKRGDTVLTVLCDNRDDERSGKQEAYRTFNPRLGTLLGVTVFN
jgi:hypothetical protein